MYVCMYVCMYANGKTLRQSLQLYGVSNVCMYVCMYLCMYTCEREDAASVFTALCGEECICMCMCMCMCVYVYIYIYIYICILHTYICVLCVYVYEVRQHRTLHKESDLYMHIQSMHIHIYVHTNIHRYIHTSMHACIHTGCHDLTTLLADM
jgi:hypothetical protein